MINITDNAIEQKIPAFFRLGFRPLFLSAGAFAAISITIWIGLLSGVFQMTPYGGSLWWHSHEMIFGFTCAVVVGFLLTAVQNWTGIAGIKGKELAFLWSIWLLARLLLLFSPSFINPFVSAAIDFMFLPLAAYFLALPIVKMKLYRNLFFVPLLLVLALCNLIMHLDVLKIDGTNYQFSLFYQHGSYAAIMLITVLMSVMGGRVIPMFTANGTQTTRREKIVLIEIMSLACVWIIALMFLLKLQTHADYRLPLAFLCLGAGILNLIRWSRWRFTKTLKVPLVWSLQVAYLCIPISFILMFFHFMWGLFTLSTVLHGLTVGAIGNMILAMMARVSLGHSGRVLKVTKAIPSAFLALIFAVISRLLGATVLIEYHLPMLQLSAALWVYGFTIFSVVYFPVLTQPRIDGRPG